MKTKHEDSNHNNKKKTQWYVYIVRCADKSLYTGITTDIQRRVTEHNGEGGARYTRARVPVTLVYQEDAESRSTASKREIVIKKMNKQKKEALLNV